MTEDDMMDLPSFASDEAPRIQPEQRTVRYVEASGKPTALQCFMIGLALYVSYSVGVTAGKPNIWVSAAGTVMVDDVVVSTCTVADLGFTCTGYGSMLAK